MTDAIEAAPDAQPEYWFIAAALLVGKDGTEGQVCQLVAATDMPTARMAFIEGTMAIHGQAGLGIRGVACQPVVGLKITRLAEALPEQPAPNPFPVGDEV